MAHDHRQLRQQALPLDLCKGMLNSRLLACAVGTDLNLATGNTSHIALDQSSELRW